MSLTARMDIGLDGQRTSLVQKIKSWREGCDVAGRQQIIDRRGSLSRTRLDLTCPRPNGQFAKDTQPRTACGHSHLPSWCRCDSALGCQLTIWHQASIHAIPLTVISLSTLHHLHPPCRRLPPIGSGGHKSQAHPPVLSLSFHIDNTLHSCLGLTASTNRNGSHRQ